MQKGTVSIYFVKSALEPLMDRGIDPAALLHAAGISPTVLQAPQGRVTADSFSILWLGVANALDDELFGQDTRRMKVGSFSMLSHILVDCATLSAALSRMVKFFNLMLDSFHCGLDTTGDHVRLTIQDVSGLPAPKVFAFETLLMLQHGLACWLIGRRIPVLAAAFSYPEPALSAEYQFMYSKQLSFNESVTSLCFDRGYLNLPVIQNDRTVREFVRNAPANIVLKYKNTNSVSAQVRRRLRVGANVEWPEFEAVAASLGVKPTTLRRRLDDEGQSFQAIKDQLRRDMAIDYLFNTSNSMAEIAARLGFAEASAFHRAFKKWAGASPGEYRMRVQKR